MNSPEIKTIGPKKLVGMKTVHTLANSKAHEVWSTFMPQRAAIKNPLGPALYAVQVYPGGLNPATFTPTTEFDSWAAQEVEAIDVANSPFEGLEIEGGKYAVFLHYGTVAEFDKTSDYIFKEWLPNSGFVVDNRAHFAYMDERYLGPNNPDSIEEIWVPIADR